MKIILKILLLFIPLIVNARTAVIYIDAIHKVDSFQLAYADGIINITDSILTLKEYNKVIVIISNEDDPIILTNRNNFKKKYIKERLAGGIDVAKDIQCLNNVLVKQGVLGSSFSQDSVDFHFIMEVKSVIDYSYFNYFFNKFLLTNQLIKKGCLNTNISFKMYLPNSSKLEKYYSINSSILINKINRIKNNNYEIIYY
jgi:hypothetical protein